MVTIKQVETKKELKRFIRFNYEMYKDNPYSVPDLYEDMLNTFSEKNAAMDFCEAAYFLAYKSRSWWVAWLPSSTRRRTRRGI